MKRTEHEDKRLKVVRSGQLSLRIWEQLSVRRVCSSVGVRPGEEGASRVGRDGLLKNDGGQPEVKTERAVIISGGNPQLMLFKAGRVIKRLMSRPESQDGR